MISFQDWSVCFPRPDGSLVKAIDKLNFDLTAGECVGIVGESGSGKSMTALSIMQLLPESAQVDGAVYWKGDMAMNTAADEELRKLRGRDIGMIFQEPLSSLNPVMRCGEQIAELLRHHLNYTQGEAQTQTKNWLHKVQLRDPDRIYKSYPHQLSGGQRQRVMIAMALCTSPQLLIADEPTTALDVTVQYAILELIKELALELGVAIIFISHDLAVIHQIAGRVLIMRSGKVVECGSVDSIFRDPKAAYTKGLLACHPPLHKRVKRLATVSDFTDKEDIDHQVFLENLTEPDGEWEKRQGKLAEASLVLQMNKVQVWFSKNRNWLGKTTEQLKAVNEVSFNLRSGECLGIVGESGSGKTTLGKSILRLVSLQGGTITFDGEDISSLSTVDFRRVQPKLQMVFQDPFNSLNPKLKIDQLLREPLQVHRSELSKKEQDDHILDILSQVGLDETVLDRYPKAFSGGQRQRIGIARTLLLQPEVLICDESVSALDVSVQAQVLNLIKSLQRKYGFSLLFISHDLSVVKFIADRILVMREGKVVELADTETLFASPKETYTKELIGAILK